MGGQIKVNSEENVGTTFSFTMLSYPSSQSLRTYVTHNVTGMEGKHILIVDDNYTNRQILNNQLELWKMIPTLAESGAEALEIMAKGTHFDLMLSDMQMPDMDGCELATQMKQLYPEIPIILLSSVGDENNKKYTGLFKSILTKPIKQEMLCRLLINELRGKSKPVKQEAEPVKPKLSVDFAKEHPLDILVVEDNLANQRLALKILSKLGFEPMLAENGKIAVEMVGKNEYDMVLMDVQMPVMDGLEATRIIRQQLATQPVIIAMTANAMKEDRDECLEAGLDDFLSKPVKPEDLMNMIAKWATSARENMKGVKAGISA